MPLLCLDYSLNVCPSRKPLTHTTEPPKYNGTIYIREEKGRMHHHSEPSPAEMVYTHRKAERGVGR